MYYCKLFQYYRPKTTCNIYIYRCCSAGLLKSLSVPSSPHHAGASVSLDASSLSSTSSSTTAAAAAAKSSGVQKSAASQATKLLGTHSHWLPQPFDAHCCHMGTAIKHPMPDRVKPSFVIFDIRVLWRSALSVRVPGRKKITNGKRCFIAVPVWQAATVCVNGLILDLFCRT